MGLVMEFDAKNNILRATLEGRVTDAILLDYYWAAARYTTSHPPCRGIWDLAEVTAPNPDWLYARPCRSARLSLWNDAHVADT